MTPGRGEESRDRKRRESRNAFSSFSPSGHQFEAPAIRASLSQTKSHGFTYYDLHPCPLPLLLFLLSSRSPSRPLPPSSPARLPPSTYARPPPSSLATRHPAASRFSCLFCLFHVSYEHFLSSLRRCPACVSLEKHRTILTFRIHRIRVRITQLR